MTRVAVIAALVAMSVAVLTAGSGRPLLEARWYRTGASVSPLQGDIPYRLGLALDAAPRQMVRMLGIDPEDLLQIGLAAYERAALPTDLPSADALFRLAVIYSRQGHPEEGLQAFERVVQLDPDRMNLYLAASCVYEPKPVPKSQLRRAAAIIEQEDQWLARGVLVDLYHRLGAGAQARRAQERAAHSDARFAGWLLGLAVIYCLLTVLGLVALVRATVTRLVRPPRPDTTSPLIVAWSALDALEVGAALLFAMVFVGQLSELVTARWQSRGGPAWVAALILLASYVVFSLLAMLVMRHRMGAAARDLLRALGLGGRPSWAAIVGGTTGYSVLVALFVCLVVVAHWAGLDYLPPAAQSTSDLLGRARGTAELAIFFVLICIAAPLLEELIFRGFIYPGLRRRLHPLLAIPLSALLFGAAHVKLAFGGMLAIAGVGILLAYLYEQRRSLWPSVVAHALHNLLVFCLIVATNL